MTEPQLPTPRLQRLPLLQTVALSYREYAANFADVLRISWVWLALLTILVFVATWLQFSWMVAAIADLKKSVQDGPTPNPVPLMPPLGSAEYLVMLLANLAVILGALCIAVAWHRRVLLGEPARSSTGLLLTELPWHYAAAVLLIILAVSAPVVAIGGVLLWLYLPQGGGFGGPFGPAMTAIAILDAIALAAFCRLSILLPALAVGNREIGFMQAWHKTAGNTLRLAWGLVLTAVVPVMIAEAIPTLLLVPSSADFLALSKGEISGLAERAAALNAVAMALILLALPIGAGFLSHAYRFLVKPSSPDPT